MKIYIVTGEKSGDLHASNLVKALKNQNKSISFRAFGGEHLKSNGVEIARDIKDLAFMGFKEVVQNLFSIKENLDFCKQDILKFHPDILILVDYAGFNLKIARFAKNNAIKTIYYIPPKVWAWNYKRIYSIKKYVDKVLAIFPFEEEIYKKHNIDVTYVGNPLISQIKNKNFNFNYQTEKKIIALLPGSREQEIQHILPLMLDVVNNFPEYQFVLAGTNSCSEEYYTSLIGDKPVDIVFNQTYSLLYSAHAALVTSGTATLETALFNVPQVVCYKTSFISYIIAKLFIKIKYISLVNILMNRLVVDELIQINLTPSNLKSALKQILEVERRQEILSSYNELDKMLSQEESPKKVADIILGLI
ncbi:MAG: lipid-A-disaccharide synthase [Bacteroidota bacterium]|nr:lipid-A-disaccharide synthase [Bacteroidota bacterium]